MLVKAEVLLDDVVSLLLDVLSASLAGSPHPTKLKTIADATTLEPMLLNLLVFFILSTS